MSEKVNEVEFITAKVIKVSRELYTLLYKDEQVYAKVSGRFKFIADFKEDYPCVGDNVIVTEEHGSYIIHKVCPRRTELSRVSTDGKSSKQLFCSNIDIVFICISANNDFNLKKLSQFISLGYASKAKTAVLITKSDLAKNPDDYLDQVHSLNTGVAAFTISAHSEEDLNVLKFLIGRQTCVFIGASGVGKSTLINQLSGLELETTDVRNTDDQGRHTTTDRQMYYLMDIDSYIIDTPGIRTINTYLMDDIDYHYSDIFELARLCKYRDCNHTHEPDCKVREAIENGELSIERYNEYLKTLKVDAYIRKKEKRRNR